MADESSWVYWSMTDYGGLGKSKWPKHYDLADSPTSFHLRDAEWSVQYGENHAPHPQRPPKLTTNTPSRRFHRLRPRRP